MLHVKVLNERKEAAQLQCSAFIRGRSECSCSTQWAGGHFPQVTLQCSVEWLYEAYSPDPRQPYCIKILEGNRCNLNVSAIQALIKLVRRGVLTIHTHLMVYLYLVSDS